MDKLFNKVFSRPLGMARRRYTRQEILAATMTAYILGSVITLLAALAWHLR